jgi:hypothetical protein
VLLLVVAVFYGASKALIISKIKERSSCACALVSSEVEPCVVWALRVSLPFLAKLIKD